jgi:hypothetical protein
LESPETGSEHFERQTVNGQNYASECLLTEKQRRSPSDSLLGIFNHETKPFPSQETRAASQELVAEACAKMYLKEGKRREDNVEAGDYLQQSDGNVLTRFFTLSFGNIVTQNPATI